MDDSELTVTWMPTSESVFNGIMQKHNTDLCVFESFTAPSGHPYLPHNTAEMLTIWGFDGSHVPLLKIVSAWLIDDNGEPASERISKYWIASVKCKE